MNNLTLNNNDKKAIDILQDIKWQLMENEDFDLVKLEKQIDDLLSLNQAYISFDYRPDNENEDKYACLPIMLMAFISSKNYTNEQFINFIKNYELEPFLGQCYSLIDNNLLTTTIYYNNFDLFTYFLDNHLEKFNINHQNKRDESILHYCVEFSAFHNNVEPYLEKLLNIPNLDINLKNNKNLTAYECMNENQKEVFDKIMIKKEKFDLENKIENKEQFIKKIKV